MKTIALLPLALLVGCQSTEPRMTQRDSKGNFATTSDYQSAQRAEFESAIRAGLADYDKRMQDLSQAVAGMPADKLEAFQECKSDLREKRSAVDNQLQRLEACLDADWPDRREETAEAYEDAREALDEAYEDLLG